MCVRPCVCVFGFWFSWPPPRNCDYVIVRIASELVTSVQANMMKDVEWTLLLPTSSSENGRSRMKQTKNNDERSKAAIVRVHINDDDRVTSCVKCEYCQQQKKRAKKVKSVLPEQADPAEPSEMNGTRPVSGRKLLGHGITSLRRHFLLCPCFVSVIEEEEDTPPAEAQRTKLSTSTKLSHSFISPRQLSSSGSGFVVVLSPYDTPHHIATCLPHQRLHSQGEAHPGDDLLLCVPVRWTPVLRACVRACMRE